MKKIKLKTNYGKVFDFVLNGFLNIHLWFKGIKDDEDKAVKLVASDINILKKHLAKYGL